MMELNLQFFAKEGPGGEKTEMPTQKKLEDARKEGQVAKSKEVANALTLLGLFILLKFVISFIGGQMLQSFSGSYNNFAQAIKLSGGYVRTSDILLMLRNALWKMLLCMAPFLMTGFVLSFVADAIQIKWMVTTKPLAPKFNKLNPVNGFKRLFSLQSLMELLKSLLKIGLAGILVYNTLKKEYNVIYLLFNMPLWQGIGVAADIAIDLGFRIACFYIIIALADYIFQRWKFTEDQKMTKQEVKDEYKNAEGDPQIKGKQRQRMQEASRRRMMQDVPKADVVITNPTHFAVAVQYDVEVAPAPIVLAKGEDHLAARIKETAREHKIEIVENKPLARMLYYNVEIGEQVPPELYQTVAEVLAMVYHMQGKI